LSSDHFRGEVAWGSADWGSFFELPLVFGEAVVGHEDLGVFGVVVVEKVLEFEVAMDDSLELINTHSFLEY
jgi:hypothetical protein